MGKKLLLADDSVTIQKVVTLTFAGENVEIDSVSDGSSALEKARTLHPDIVLADVSMPGLNGYQLCERIKNDPQLTDTPVILLVGTFEPFDEAEASRVHCDGHLTKPFESSRLVEAVQSLIGRSRPKMKGRPVAADASGSSRAEPSLVSSRTLESFLGAKQILELFGTVQAGQRGEHRMTLQPASEALPPLPSLKKARVAAAGDPDHAPAKAKGNSAGGMHVIPFPGTRANTADLGPAWLSEDMLDMIVERVMRQLSPAVIREVAWEVVPEMAEVIIRQVLKEQGTTD